jgi:hypothetical protein
MDNFYEIILNLKLRSTLGTGNWMGHGMAHGEIDMGQRANYGDITASP